MLICFAPALVKTPLARVISAGLLAWTEIRRLPPLTLPSRRVASRSGMPRPMSPPAIPPAAAPMAATLRAAMIGPTATKGPMPGMANAPIPAMQPNVPPMTPPVPAPVTAVSGAFVFLLCANTRVEFLPGNNTEMSLPGKCASLS